MLFQWVICGGVLVKFEDIRVPYYSPRELVKAISKTFLKIKTLKPSDIQIWKGGKCVGSEEDLLEFNSSATDPFRIPLSPTHFKDNDDIPADGGSEE